MASQWPEWAFPTSSVTASQAHLFPKAFSMPEIVLFLPQMTTVLSQLSLVWMPWFPSIGGHVHEQLFSCHVWTVGSQISMADLLSSMQTEMVSTWISSMCVEMIQQN